MRVVDAALVFFAAVACQLLALFLACFATMLDAFGAPRDVGGAVLRVGYACHLAGNRFRDDWRRLTRGWR